MPKGRARSLGAERLRSRQRCLAPYGFFLEVALFGLVLGLPYLFMAWKLRNAELRFAIRDAEGARAVAGS